MASGEDEEISGGERKKLYEYDREEDEIGFGKYGVVYWCRQCETGAEYAIKEIPLRNSSEKLLRREVEVLKSIKHDGILQVIDVFRDQHKLYIVTELARGDLEDLFQNREFKESDVRSIILRLLTSLEFMHSKNIVHRDLKPENILLRNKDDINDVVIADMGFARKISSTVMMTKDVGTPMFMSPDVLRKDCHYDAKVDMWSLGIISYFFLSASSPYSTKNHFALMEIILHGKEKIDFKGEKWTTISEGAKDFIRKCTIFDPEKRLSSKEALKHVWFSGAASETIVPSDELVKELSKSDSGENVSPIPSTHSIRATGVHASIPQCDRQAIRPHCAALLYNQYLLTGCEGGNEGGRGGKLGFFDLSASPLIFIPAADYWYPGRCRPIVSMTLNEVNEKKYIWTGGFGGLQVWDICSGNDSASRLEKVEKHVRVGEKSFFHRAGELHLAQGSLTFTREEPPIDLEHIIHAFSKENHVKIRIRSSEENERSEPKNRTFKMETAQKAQEWVELILYIAICTQHKTDLVWHRVSEFIPEEPVEFSTLAECHNIVWSFDSQMNLRGWKLDTDCRSIIPLQTLQAGASVYPGPLLALSDHELIVFANEIFHVQITSEDGQLTKGPPLVFEEKQKTAISCSCLVGDEAWIATEYGVIHVWSLKEKKILHKFEWSPKAPPKDNKGLLWISERTEDRTIWGSKAKFVQAITSMIQIGEVVVCGTNSGLLFLVQISNHELLKDSCVGFNKYSVIGMFPIPEEGPQFQLTEELQGSGYLLISVAEDRHECVTLWRLPTTKCEEQA